MQNAVPLRNSDRVAGMILAVLYVESALFSASLILAWLVGASEAFAVVGQGRLFAALAVATNVRSCTRLPRLCVEVFALPWVFRQVRSRAIDLRASFVKDRAAQTLAVTAVVFLTLRAAEQGPSVGHDRPSCRHMGEVRHTARGCLVLWLISCRCRRGLGCAGRVRLVVRRGSVGDRVSHGGRPGRTRTSRSARARPHPALSPRRPRRHLVPRNSSSQPWRRSKKEVIYRPSRRWAG